ncbi:MAG: TonB-dependent receptor, partial [Planctomycetota bacterium]
MWKALLVATALLCQDPEPEPEPPPQQDEPKEIVITAKRRESDVLRVPSGVTVVTREQIEKSGASDIKQILERTPSLFAQSDHRDGHDAIIDMRGFNNGSGTGQRTLVFLNGRRTNNVNNSSTDWASIPLANVERIEIIRGPAAAMYGDASLAGVINIITRKGEGEHKWRMRLAGGSFDTLEGYGGIAGEWEGLSYDVFVMDRTTDGWRDNSRFEAIDAMANLEYPLAEGWDAWLRLTLHEDDRQRPGSLTKDEIAQFGVTHSSTDGFPGDADRFEFAIDTGVTHTTGEHGEFSLQATHVRTRMDSDTAAFGGFVFTDSDFEQTGLYLQHVIGLDLAEREWILTSGIDFTLGAADGASTFAETDVTRRLFGLYAHLEVQPVDRLTVAGSLRFDRADLEVDRDNVGGGGFDESPDFDQYTTSIGATYSPLEHVSLYAGYGRPFKYPTEGELAGVWAGTPDLNAERAHSFQIGVRGRYKRCGSFDVSYYRMDVKNEIFWDPTAGFFGSNINFDKV